MIHTVTTKKKDIRIEKKPEQKVMLTSVALQDKKTTATLTVEYEVVQ